MIDVSQSLKNESKSNTRLLHFGDVGLSLGIGWNVAQLFSFIPSVTGQVLSFVGIVLWILIHRINKELK